MTTLIPLSDLTLAMGLHRAARYDEPADRRNFMREALHDHTASHTAMLAMERDIAMGADASNALIRAQSFYQEATTR